jgi:23S rRNA (uracil747-C5)-methyltransferase
MGVPYRRQLQDKQEAAQAALRAFGAGLTWEPPFAGPEAGYRNKAKWAVGGDSRHPTIGILDEHKEGIDLRACGICEPLLRSSFPMLADAITEIGLTPYDINRRAGELKYLIVTASPDGELMVRFVLRSTAQLAAVRSALPALQAALPSLAVLSVNLHPEHKAVVEGEQEIVLTDRGELPMRLNDVTLHLPPRSFFQTNTVVAAGLYRQAARWATEIAPASVLDLYCGVGGFALHCAPASAREVRGIEISAEAIQGARASAATMPNPARYVFDSADAADPVRLPDTDADLVIVNPPRRGIGPALAEQLQNGAAGHVLYSSCNVASLVADLARMPSLRPRRARLFDMFPQTGHVEVAVLLDRV